MMYCHTQKAPLGSILLIVAALEAAVGLLFWDQVAVMLLLLGIGGVVFVFAFAFGQLTVRDEGDQLAVRYGPLPLFRKRIPYADITPVESDESLLIDGWGIHYIPWRGWIYNLWGLDCVKITLGDKVLRVGSDDVSKLLEFLQGQIRHAEHAGLTKP